MMSRWRRFSFAMRQNPTKVDAVILSIIAISAVIISGEGDFFESFYQFSRAYEAWEIDEIAINGLIVGLASFLFLLRRGHHLRREVRRRREAEASLIDAMASLRQQSQAKSEFLAGVSHELRTPLNAIIGFSNVMKGEVIGPIGNERYSGYILDIHSSAVHLLGVVNDLINLSKLDAGALTLDIEAVDLAEEMRRCVPLVTEATHRPVEDVRLPFDRHRCLIAADSQALRQIIINLLSNALRYAPPEAPINVGVEHREEDILLLVEDRGPGFSQEALDRLWQPFTLSGLSSRMESSGAGLGLIIVKRLANAMGGDLQITEREGGGARVTVSFRAAPGMDERGEDALQSLGMRKVDHHRGAVA